MNLNGSCLSTLYIAPSPSQAAGGNDHSLFLWFEIFEITLLYTNFYSDGPARTSLFLSFSSSKRMTKANLQLSMAFLNGRSVSDLQSSYSRYTLHTIRRTLGKKVVQNLGYWDGAALSIVIIFPKSYGAPPLLFFYFLHFLFFGPGKRSQNGGVQLQRVP
jgi:hypothetical protein